MDGKKKTEDNTKKDQDSTSDDKKSVTWGATTTHFFSKEKDTDADRAKEERKIEEICKAFINW